MVFNAMVTNNHDHPQNKVLLSTTSGLEAAIDQSPSLVRHPSTYIRSIENNLCWSIARNRRPPRLRRVQVPDA